MNKTQLVDNIATEAGVSKVDANRMLDAFLKTVTQQLQSGDSIVLVGFGTFVVRERAAREGRNPQTGESIPIKASKIPAFKAGKKLKDAVQ